MADAVEEGTMLKDSVTENISERIEDANRRAIDILTKAQATWVDVVPAREFIPGFQDNLILFAGPPLDPRNAVKPVRTAIAGAAVQEGLAKTLEEAWEMVLREEIILRSALDYSTAGGGLGPVTASTPVLVVEDTLTGSRGCCGIYEGSEAELLRWGFYTPKIGERLTWFQEELGPVLGEMVRGMGGLNVRSILARATGMGDENHYRNAASNALLMFQMFPALIEMPLEDGVLKRVTRFLGGYERFFLHVLLGGAVAITNAMKGIECSTVMVAIGGNGHEFGMKFADTGDQWFRVKAPKFTGVYLNPKWTDDDVCAFIGDSCMVEAYGFGGLAAAAGAAVVRMTGGSFRDAMQRTEESRQVCLGAHDWAPIPWLDFQGPPCGIDMRKVVASGIAPIVHGGMAHKDGGQGGGGYCRLPMDCFVQGLRAFAARRGL
jgi:hypothetical protein